VIKFDGVLIMLEKSQSVPFVWLGGKGNGDVIDDKRLELLLKLQSLAKMLQFRQDEPTLEPITLQHYGVLMEELVTELLNTY